ncbi:MAG: hypothetical protein EOO44_11780 [Flavobacterium sp.]|nr:MAG: hypothetical protein EOO44_11780 [Flavobacterium sp.]
MKTKTSTPMKTKFVLINAELQQNNLEVENAHTQITKEAILLLRKFEVTKFRSWVNVEHCMDSKQQQLVREWISFFWNITLSNNKEGKSYIFISIDESAIEKFGSGLTNLLLRKAYLITHAQNDSLNIEYSLRVNFMPRDIHSFFYRRLVDGETDIVSIFTEQHLAS